MQARDFLCLIRNGATRLASSQASELRVCSPTRLSPWPSRTASAWRRWCRSASPRFACTSVSMEVTQKKPCRVVEHIVLLKVKEGASADQQDAMILALRSLKCLKMVVELNAGKVVQATSEPYTHALHCRYMSKADLESYASDPYHLEVVNKYIVPIVEDRLALDWEADIEDPVLLGPPYGAVRIITMKPKQDLESSDLANTIDALRQHKSRFPFIKQVSTGKNFSPARAKDYEWAYLAIFPNLDELLKLKNSDEENALRANVSSAMEKVNIVDYRTT